MKKLILTGASILMISAAAAGCASKNGTDKEGMNDNLQNVNYDNQAERDYNNNQMNDGMMNDGNYSISEEAANKVANLDNVKSSYVMATDHNAYVAAVLDNGKLSKDLEDKITKQVKETNGSIHNVYISTNPAFVDRMKDYSGKVKNGQPIEGLGEEISGMIRSVFPNRNQ
ncbi:YhcN/YlaJ family sporulation lipoprotein [Rossellomorea marisflavi]|jgi:YhcN/YlaJ family sporulation lipoprotein|nr:YhcN/YlaJ family sporulation lipoprotein [Rossellomorea marisflavi]KQU59970.1 hypothetical protein ASG66_09805 [Bacillus sp. Leaf406]VXB77620.1 conserved exported hypothetical protein [Bacillus sp. 349Y]KMK97374.1 hypothetical protein VL03_01330 [Rossellomorea marisflavi]KML06950.1 hypothetical protein VL06_07330 [Rossellomorea marisflavi]KML35264.1 hypothetical protein VL12_00240 [Rossellomorea marisflavi]